MEKRLNDRAKRNMVHRLLKAHRRFMKKAGAVEGEFKTLPKRNARNLLGF